MAATPFVVLLLYIVLVVVVIMLAVRFVRAVEGIERSVARAVARYERGSP